MILLVVLGVMAVMFGFGAVVSFISMVVYFVLAVAMCLDGHVLMAVVPFAFFALSLLGVLQLSRLYAGVVKSIRHQLKLRAEDRALFRRD